MMTKILIHAPQKPMIPLTDDKSRKHKKSKYYHICLEPFSNNEEDEKYNNYKKVRDDCHYTGKYKNPAPSKWNLQ